MLTASRALALNADAAPELPRIAALDALYRKGMHFRQGEVVMIAGRSGTQKSGFALWLTVNWNLPTLYLSADMNGYQASTRIGGMLTSQTTEMVERQMNSPQRNELLDVLNDLNLTFSFASPITFPGLGNELMAYIELHNAYPKVIVIDNLMDIEGCDSDYSGQMNALQEISAMARNTGATIVILHHATDKSTAAEVNPYSPPSRSEIKGGLSEKPELSLSVAINPHNGEYRVAVIKQRMGPSDPTARNYTTLQAHPEMTQFSAYTVHRHLTSV